MTSTPPTGDRAYLEELLVRIDQHGVVAQHHSNLVAVASRLHYLRTQETSPDRKERLDLELDAVMRILDGREPHVPRSIDQHLEASSEIPTSEIPRSTEREFDAAQAVYEANQPHARVPGAAPPWLREPYAEDLHRRMLDIFEAAVDRLAAARPGGA